MAKKTAKKSAKKVTRKRQPKKTVEEKVEAALNGEPAIATKPVEEIVEKAVEFDPETFRAQSLEEPEVEEEIKPRERAIEVVPGDEIKRWRKDGKGSLIFKVEGEKTRIIKPGQIFNAREKDIPQGFRMNIISIDEVNKAELAPVKSVTKYIMCTSKEDKSKFDVRNEATGKKMNDAPLTGEEVESTLASLNG